MLGIGKKMNASSPKIVRKLQYLLYIELGGGIEIPIPDNMMRKLLLLGLVSGTLNAR